jgi:septum formation protein
MNKESASIVLASGSPRRRELLASVGLSFTVVPSCASEEVLPGESAEEHVVRLSLAKAREVAARPEVCGRWFIGSDTVVVRDGEILGKPADAGDAARMLRSLSGRSHRVLSGYAIVDRNNEVVVAEAVSTLVRFRELTETEIAGYIASGEPFDKAGAYAIQGLGAFMVRGIEGSYTNVVGLPLCEVVEALQRAGAAELFPGAG